MPPMQRSFHHRKSASPATQPPRFALVMHENAIVKHIQMIPLKSSMIFGDELSEFATLTAPNGKAWQVRLNKCAERIWLCDGLKEFVEYYKIHYASIVQFTYQGSSSFHVCIFDAMGSEIDYPHDEPSSENKRSDDSNDDESVEILETSTPIRKRKNCFPLRKRGRPPKHSRGGASMAHEARNARTSCENEEACHLKENKKSHSHDFCIEHEEFTEMVLPLCLSYSKTRKLNLAKETEKAVHAARMCRLKNPSFMAILRLVNVINNFVTVPADFVKRHLDSPWEEEYIQLQVHNGKQKWPVRYYSDRRGVSSSFKRISTGWGSFSSENNLVEGDVCVFELINKEENNILLRVWIYRAAEHADALPTQKRLKAE